MYEGGQVAISDDNAGVRVCVCVCACVRVCARVCARCVYEDAIMVST